MKVRKEACKSLSYEHRRLCIASRHVHSYNGVAGGFRTLPFCFAPFIKLAHPKLLETKNTDLLPCLLFPVDWAFMLCADLVSLGGVACILFLSIYVIHCRSAAPFASAACFVKWLTLVHSKSSHMAWCNSSPYYGIRTCTVCYYTDNEDL